MDDGLGARMRFMRRQRNITLDQLADLTGLTKSYLSKIERQRAVPSVTTALRVSKAFGISVGQLLGETVDDAAICVVRKGEGTPFLGASGKDGGFNYQAIASGRAYKAMDPFIIRPPADFQSPGLFTHAGEEFLYVLDGQVELEFPDRIVRLDAGDSVYFDSLVPHRARSSGPQIATALVVVVGDDRARGRSAAPSE